MPHESFASSQVENGIDKYMINNPVVDPDLETPQWAKPMLSHVNRVPTRKLSDTLGASNELLEKFLSKPFALLVEMLVER